jgi:hypothetical protein
MPRDVTLAQRWSGSVIHDNRCRLRRNHLGAAPFLRRGSAGGWMNVLQHDARLDLTVCGALVTVLLFLLFAAGWYLPGRPEQLNSYDVGTDPVCLRHTVYAPLSSSLGTGRGPFGATCVT